MLLRFESTNNFQFTRRRRAACKCSKCKHGSRPRRTRNTSINHNLPYLDRTDKMLGTGISYQSVDSVVRDEYNILEKNVCLAVIHFDKHI